MKTLRGLWIKDSQPKIWLCVLLLMLHRKDLDDCLFAAFIHLLLTAQGLSLFLSGYSATAPSMPGIDETNSINFLAASVWTAVRFQMRALFVLNAGESGRRMIFV